MFKPDTISADEMKRVAGRLTPWFDSQVVERLVSATGDTSLIKQALLPDIDSGDALSDQAHESGGIHLPPEFMLEECFAICMLGADAIADPGNLGKDMKELVRETSRWHHQIKANGKPVAFARSKASAYAEGCEVCQLYVSNLAAATDDAIKWLIKYEAEFLQDAQHELLVRMLAVPAHNVHAFWLSDKQAGQSQLLVIDAPAEFDGLKRHQLLSSAEFLKAFEGQSPITGLSLDNSDEDEADEEAAMMPSRSRNTNNAPIKTEREGGINMSDQEETAAPNTDTDDEQASIKFHVPDVKGQQPQAKFIASIFDAATSKAFFKDGSQEPSASGPGKPLYSAYAFPYVSPDEPKSDGSVADSSAQKPIQPLYVAYIYPFQLPNEVKLAGDVGGHGALGGEPGEDPLFLSEIRALTPAEDDKESEPTKENPDASS